MNRSETTITVTARNGAHYSTQRYEDGVGALVAQLQHAADRLARGETFDCTLTTIEHSPYCEEYAIATTEIKWH